jgi:transglutaminase-like putative cysteine protease
VKPTYIHGFNLASTVARDKSGDCTEYAVLSAAMARALGHPAKVVFGTVIAYESGSVNAYGHAWTEVYSEHGWQRLDAALYGAGAKRLFYLPSGTLVNEGPGYMLSVIKATKNLPVKITEFSNQKDHID